MVHCPQVWAAPGRKAHQYEALVPPRHQGRGLQGEALELWGSGPQAGAAIPGPGQPQGPKALTGLLPFNEHKCLSAVSLQCL